MPLSIRLIFIVVILNDVHFPLVHADGHNPIKPWRHRPALSKRTSASTRSHSPLHVPRGGGHDILPQTPPQPQPSHTSNQDDDYSTPPSPYEYIPVTALDDYGQSIQLRHAMQAAQRYGTPVIACLCRVDHDHDDDDDDHTNESSPVENAILVCSLQRPQRGIIAPTPDTSCGILRTVSTTGEGHPIVHPSIRGMVHIVTTRDDVPTPHPSTHHDPSTTTTNSITPWTPRHALHTALVVTGLQSDAYYLLQTLRNYCISKYWFRYDALPSSSSSSSLGMVRLVREILLDFQGYDWNKEVGSSMVSGGIGGASSRNSGEEDDDNDDAVRAGRPLGLCTLLLGLDPESTTTTMKKQEERPSLTVVRANGSSEGYVAYAMGVGSEGGNEKLSRLWRRGMTVEEAKAMMREILREIAVEKGWLDDEKKNSLRRNRLEDEMVHSHRVNEVDGCLEDSSIASEFTIVCETVTARGIDIEYLNL